MNIKENIVIQYLAWYFFDVPKNIIKAWRNFLLFNLDYFSVPLLLKTLFSPWRRYEMPYGKGFDIGRFFEAFFSNLLFRIMGAMIRIGLIIIGIFMEILLLIGGAIVFLGWLTSPVILIYGLILGFKVIF